MALAANGADALALAGARRPDLIVLDLGLPGMDGLDVTRRLRTQSSVPIIMLTARAEESDTLIGLEGLLDDVYARDDRQVSDLLEEVHVLSRLVEDLRMLALLEAGALKLQKEATDISALARDVARTFAADATSHGVNLTVHGSAAEPVSVDPVRIREVLTNLLANALRHTPARGAVDLSVAASRDGAVVVDIRDTGSGMTAEVPSAAKRRSRHSPRQLHSAGGGGAPSASILFTLRRGGPRR